MNLQQRNLTCVSTLYLQVIKINNILKEKCKHFLCDVFIIVIKHALHLHQKLEVNICPQNIPQCLSQQGVWGSSRHPTPQKTLIWMNKSFLWGISKIINFKQIIEYFTAQDVHKDITPFSCLQMCMVTIWINCGFPWKKDTSKFYNCQFWPPSF